MRVRKTKQQIDAETAVEEIMGAAVKRTLSKLAGKMKERQR